MARYRFKHGNKPASQAARINLVVYSPPTLEINPIKMIVSDQTKQSVVENCELVAWISVRIPATFTLPRLSSQKG